MDGICPASQAIAMAHSGLFSGEIFNPMQRFHSSLRTALLALAPLLIPTDAMAAPVPLAAESRINALLNELRDYKLDVVEGRTHKRFMRGHHELLGLYWQYVAEDNVAALKSPQLIRGKARFRGCGRARASNAYCPESNQIGIDISSIRETRRISPKAKARLLGMTVLAHEWGHHINHNSSRGDYTNREEDAADWRAGRYLGWLISRGALSVKDYTDAANLFFRIGDFHYQSPHAMPSTRFRAFIAGVRAEVQPELVVRRWTMDTSETFSRPVAHAAAAPGSDLSLKVYRFEIERGGQIAGNLFSAAMGVLNCAYGTSSACAGSIQNQGKAMPDGWYRLRKMSINCEDGSFDIESDGIKRQAISKDRKGQAQRIANRFCPAINPAYGKVAVPMDPPRTSKSSKKAEEDSWER